MTEYELPAGAAAVAGCCKEEQGGGDQGPERRPQNVDGGHRAGRANQVCIALFTDCPSQQQLGSRYFWSMHAHQARPDHALEASNESLATAVVYALIVSPVANITDNAYHLAHPTSSNIWLCY